jgi:putative ABC transport system permease protein
VNVFKMAWRNVLRNRRRSVVTIGAMAFALFVEVLYAGLIPGYIGAMEQDVTNLDLGDIQIHHPDYRQTPSIYSDIEDPGVVLAGLDDLGYPAAARLLGGGLAASGEFSAGVALVGVDVARETLDVSGVSEKVSAGSWLSRDDPTGVVVGRRLALTLNVKPGGEVLLLSQATDGSMAHELYAVRGVLSSVAEATDRATIYMHDSAFRDLMVMPAGAHRIVVRRPKTVPLEDAKAAVVGLAGDLEVKTWKELMPIIAQMLDSVNGLIYVLYFIVYIAVAILILNAMLMAVFERIKEFGVLKAIGAGPFRVMGLILVESAIQAGVAIAVGLLCAAPFMWYLAEYGWNVGAMGGMSMVGLTMRQVWFGYYSAETIAGPVIMLVVIVGMAIWYPALKAAWISPVNAMRHR